MLADAGKSDKDAILSYVPNGVDVSDPNPFQTPFAQFLKYLNLL